MKEKVSEYRFRDSFKEMNRDYFSADGYRVLFDHLTALEEGAGEEMELDPIAICSEYTEYPDEEEAIYDWDADDLGELQERLIVLPVDGGRLIVQEG